MFEHQYESSVTKVFEKNAGESAVTRSKGHTLSSAGMFFLQKLRQFLVAQFSFLCDNEYLLNKSKTLHFINCSVSIN